MVLTVTGMESAPTAAQVAGPALVLCGLVLLGRSVGWRSLPLLTGCVVLVGYLGSALFYDNQADVPLDLRSSGMDEIGRDPASVIFLLPAIWLVLAGSVLSRGRQRRPVDHC